MKLGIITRTNNKGQLVIPQEFRKTLGITARVPLNLTIRDNGMFMHPVVNVIGTTDTEDSYSQILARTKGAWSSTSYPSTAKKRQLELAASKRRKQAW